MLLLGIAVPALLLMVLRVNAVLVFLSVCLGSVLLEFVASDGESFADLFAPSAKGSTVNLVLLLIPVVLTTLFMLKTMHGGKLAINVLPSIGVGFLLTLLVVPYVSPGLAYSLMGSQTWHEIQKLQALVIGASAILCLLLLWTQRPKHHHDKHGKHHKL